MIPPGLDRDRGKTLRAPVILGLLGEEIPDAVIALHYRNTWELLLVTILSAQTTDKLVNVVSPSLFARWPGPQELAGANLADIEQAVARLGFFRQKAKNIQGCARAVLTDHGGEVPATMEELLTLPGVARKTANVVLSNGFGDNQGVVVDTHIGRLARRLAFTKHTDPVKVEKDLMRLFSREDWLRVADLLIHHGRRTCDAQRPRCDDCVIEPLCPSSQVAGRRDRR